MKQLRPKVLLFAEAMDTQLDKHSYKDPPNVLVSKTEGWHDCPPLFLQEKLLEEVAELLVATAPARSAEFWTLMLHKKILEAEEKPKGSVLEEAADTSNVSLMIADNAEPLKAQTFTGGQ